MKNLLFLLFALYSLQSFSQSEKRLALVIGNADYQYGGELKNPVNDANLMASTLETLGFTVIRHTDASLKEMQLAFRDFAGHLDKYDVALFFYAGHGVQVNGENFLLPVDAKVEDEMSLEFEAFEVSDVSKYMASSHERTNIMILDACRDNPYRSWSRGGERGFKAIQNQGAGSIIAFATKEGQTASDGSSGENGLFTQYLVKQMLIPQNITEVFQNTRVEVLKASSYKQVPQEWNMLTGNFWFKNDHLEVETKSKHQNVSQNDKQSLNVMSEEKSAENEVFPNSGKLLITSELGGTIYLDNKPISEIESNPNSQEIVQVPSGKHVLQIKSGKEFTRPKNITVYSGSSEKIHFNSEGLIFDARDGKYYSFIELGGKKWMNENVNVFVPNSIVRDGHRFYTFKSANMYACPDGWRLPTKEEVQDLINSLGGENEAGRVLHYGQGENKFYPEYLGFYTREDDQSSNKDKSAYWTSTSSKSFEYGYYWYIYKDRNGEKSSRLIHTGKESYFNCRCVRD